MGAYTRWYERGIERALRRDKSRGIHPPPRTPALDAASAGPAADRRKFIPPLGLREYWYPALPARRVPRRKPFYWRMLGEEIAFFRDKDGNVAAVTDVCPHRGASMSEGFCFYKGTISCPYHGATFDRSGECKAFLPEGPDSKMEGNLRIRTYPTRTLRGWVFIWMGTSEPVAIERDVPPEFFDEGPTVVRSTYTYWHCGWILAIENQNDSHNGFFLHRNSHAQLTMNRLSRARTPFGPRTKLLNDAALIPLMKNQKHYADETGKEPFHLHYPGVDGVWPLGHWRKWVWALFKPWYKIVYNPWRTRRPYRSVEEWADPVGASLWHLPSMIRVNNGLYMLTRYAVPVEENLSRIVYFNHRWRPRFKVVEWLQSFWYYAFFNWWFHYNFSGQDGWATAQCRYWTEENLSATDSHLVMLRKLVTERSRDVLLAKSAAAPVPASDAEQRLFERQRQAGVAAEDSLDSAAQVTERAPVINYIVDVGDKR